MIDEKIQETSLKLMSKRTNVVLFQEFQGLCLRLYMGMFVIELMLKFRVA